MASSFIYPQRDGLYSFSFYAIHWLVIQYRYFLMLLTKSEIYYSASFIPSLIVWSVTKNNAFGGERQNQKEQR